MFIKIQSIIRKTALEKAGGVALPGENIPAELMKLDTCDQSMIPRDKNVFMTDNYAIWA